MYWEKLGKSWVGWDFFFCQKPLFTYMMWQTYEKDACAILYFMLFPLELLIFIFFFSRNTQSGGRHKCSQDWLCLWVVIMCVQSWTIRCFCVHKWWISHVSYCTCGSVVMQRKLKGNKCCFSSLTIGRTDIIAYT